MTVTELARDMTKLPPNALVLLPGGESVKGIEFEALVRDKASGKFLDIDSKEAKGNEALEVVNAVLLR